MKTALIVDTDLGFLFWLADVLATAGYQAYPAESVTAAESLLDRVQSGIDLLVVNPMLPLAACLVESLGNLPHPPFILALESDPDAAHPELPGVTAWLSKPHPQDEAATLAWREALLRRLAEGGEGVSFLRH